MRGHAGGDAGDDQGVDVEQRQPAQHSLAGSQPAAHRDAPGAGQLVGVGVRGDLRCTGGPAGVHDGDSAVLLAEFRTWLDRERGLSPVSVRCYSEQSKAFLAGIGGAGTVSELDAGRVTAFMVDSTQGGNTWSAKAMVTSLRAFLRFAHATRRTAAPAGSSGSRGRVVAGVLAAPRPEGGRGREAAGRLRPGDPCAPPALPG